MKRSSGILTHISSLPGPYATGTFGKSAFSFIDFIRSMGFSHWQILPLTPPGKGDSPYTSLCAFAGNPNFIDPEKLMESGLLTREEAQNAKCPEAKYACAYDKAEKTQMSLLKTAFHRADAILRERAEAFSKEQSEWLDDYALYMALKYKNELRPWWEFEDEGLRLHEKGAVERAQKELENEISFWKFVQYLFFTQWSQLKAYANQKGVSIIGDMPFYVSLDSSDAWANPSSF